MKTRIVVVLSFFALAVAFPATVAFAQGKKGGSKKAKSNEKKKGQTGKSDSGASNSDMKIVDAKAAGGVKEREPVDVSESFSVDDKVTIWMAVRNPKGKSKVKVVWFKDDVELNTVDINVGKSWRWRTWARRTVPRTGDWKVEIRDEDGNTLETVEFAVDES